MRQLPVVVDERLPATPHARVPRPVVLVLRALEAPDPPRREARPVDAAGGSLQRGALVNPDGALASLDERLNQLVLVAARLARDVGPGHALLFVSPVDPRDEEEVPRRGLDGAGPREQEVRERIPHDSKAELVARVFLAEEVDDLSHLPAVAEDLLAEKIRESRQAAPAALDREMTLAAYAERWLGHIATDIKASTLTSYSDTLTRYILPALGRVKVRALHRGLIKDLLGRKRADGLSKNTVRVIRAVFSVLLGDAVDDGIITTKTGEIRRVDVSQQLARALAGSRSSVPRRSCVAAQRRCRHGCSPRRSARRSTCTTRPASSSACSRTRSSRTSASTTCATRSRRCSWPGARRSRTSPRSSGTRSRRRRSSGTRTGSRRAGGTTSPRSTRRRGPQRLLRRWSRRRGRRRCQSDMAPIGHHFEKCRRITRWKCGRRLAPRAGLEPATS